jgi:hypothetical protein
VGSHSAAVAGIAVAVAGDIAFAAADTAASKIPHPVPH